jgi:DNA-binding MarR family transcriptional regulator
MRKGRSGSNGVRPVELGNIGAPHGGNHQVGQQAQRIRDQLGSVLRLVEQLPGAPETMEHDSPVTEKMIREIIRMRRKRDQFFEKELFADPAWDILLELYLGVLSQQRVTITSLCAAAAVPPTTGLRWIGILEAKGLINRRADPFDGRRVFMSLSTEGLQRMEEYFRNASSDPFI